MENGRALTFDSIISNRKNIKFDTPPVIKGDRTLVPLRAISEGFKVDVEWNGDDREVTITKGDKKILIQIYSNIIFVNGEQIEIDSKAEVMTGRTYVPLRFIAETLGIDVEWDQETQTIELKEDLETLKNEYKEEFEELKEEYNDDLEDFKEDSEETESDFDGTIEQHDDNEEYEDGKDEDDEDDDDE